MTAATNETGPSGAADLSPPRGVDVPWRVDLVRTALLAGLVLVLGVAGSAYLAGAVGRRDGDRSREALALSSEEVASTIRLAIQREEDLAVFATGYFLRSPNASNADFEQWATSVSALERYPELLGWGEVVIVEPSELEAFGAHAASDPAGVVADAPFALYPPADGRPFYCLFLVGQTRATPGPEAAGGAPPGFDYCAGAQGAPTLAGRDSGHSSYQGVDTGTGSTLAVQVPFYEAGAVPATVAGRREAFIGWVGLGFDPKVLLDIALEHRPGTAVVVRFDDGRSSAEFASGAAPDGDSATVDLGNGWTVETFGAVAETGVFANGSARLVLLAGVASSLALAGLVLALGTGRARALRTVVERTGDLRYQALHDALTGLPNRVLIMDRIDQMLARNRRNHTVGAALFVDLDDFKNINDTLGHEAGDRLLVAVATRLTNALRDADTIGRMGGDEFVVLVDGAAAAASPELVAQRLLDVMREPFDIDGTALPITANASVGIAIGDRASGGDLLRDADVALYQAKGAGRNQFATFDPEMQTEFTRHFELESDLRSAIGANQFRLVYLPIYNLDDLTVVGVEALLRWDHPTIGPIPPGEFIPILEQSGQIQHVGRWVLHQACAQMAAWHAAGDTLDVSVNVSGRQLDHTSIVDDIRDALASSGLEPGSLIIEVTESALMRSPSATTVRLQAMKALGVRIAVDDFGTGYSSLAYLQQFPVDSIKIDRLFTNAIATSPESRALVRTLVQLGRDLGLRTLAEGVETEGEIDHLRQQHVHEAQGFLLSRPLDPTTLEERLLAPSRPQRPDGPLRTTVP